MTARDRSINEAPEIGTHRNYKNGVQQSNVATTTMREFNSRMVDEATERFRERITAGEIINNPCAMSVQRRTTTGSGSVIQTQIASPHNIWQAYGSGTITGYYIKYGNWGSGYPGVTPHNLIKLSNIAKANALANVDKTPSSLIADVFEIRETMRFLRDPIASLRDLTSLFKRDLDRKLSSFKVYDAKKYAKAHADVYLQYRFALSPLVRTTLQLMENYEKKVYRPSRATARGSSEPPQIEELKTVIKTQGSRTLHYQCSSVALSSARAGILYEVKNPLTDWKYEYGLRFKDIPSGLWAVTPYSFLVDRIWNVSRAIRGWTNLLDPNVEILAGWCVTKASYRKQIGIRSINEPGYVSFITPDDIVDSTFTMNRDVWSPSAFDALTMPDLKGLVDTASKTHDLLALIIQNLAKPKNRG